jgi:hypothetical protein
VSVVCCQVEVCLLCVVRCRSVCCVLSGRGLCVVCCQVEVCVLCVLSGGVLSVVSVVCCQVEVCLLRVVRCRSLCCVLSGRGLCVVR